MGWTSEIVSNNEVLQGTHRAFFSSFCPDARFTRIVGMENNKLVLITIWSRSHLKIWAMSCFLFSSLHDSFEENQHKILHLFISMQKILNALTRQPTRLSKFAPHIQGYPKSAQNAKYNTATNHSTSTQATNHYTGTWATADHSHKYTNKLQIIWQAHISRPSFSTT